MSGASKNRPPDNYFSIVSPHRLGDEAGEYLVVVAEGPYAGDKAPRDFLAMTEEFVEGRFNGSVKSATEAVVAGQFDSWAKATIEEGKFMPIHTGYSLYRVAVLTSKSVLPGDSIR